MMIVRSDSLETCRRALFEDSEILAIHVRGYAPEDVLRHAREHVIPRLLRGSVRRIYRSQIPAFSTVARGGPAEGEAYLRRSWSVLRAMRLAFQPYANPADVFRAEIDELSPWGARLLHLDGRPVVFGMLRSWDPGMRALPHFDIIQRSGAAPLGGLAFKEQFGVNVYLETPERGGELLVWNVTLPALLDAGHRAQEDAYGFDPHRLPRPDLVIQPAPGDLIMVRSTRLHAVAATAEGRRITISGFLGIGGESDGVMLWS
ncbi:2OG-Fe(II) oxygenase [Bailinhaonella thermotolerans]|uniref:2OG-Fe(II)-dependent halogenase WelO5 family protein n=1 Tax=Bailinhaonella thermotolerans TaxID=1070861 RepID=UPI00192A6D2A